MNYFLQCCAIILLGYHTTSGALAFCGTTTNARNTTGLYRIVTVVEPPFVFKNTTCLNIFGGTGDENELKCYSGFCIDLINIIREDIQLNYTIFDVSEYGEPSNTTAGNWTGMIGHIMNNKADIALGALEVTAERQKVIDFTTPFKQSEGNKSYAIGIKKGNSKLQGSLSHMIAKLVNQRHLELLTEKWWVDNRSKDGKFSSP